MSIKGIGFDIDGTLYSNKYLLLGTLPTFFKHPRLTYHFSFVRAKIRKIRPVVDFDLLQANLLASRMNISEEMALFYIRERLFKKWKSSFRVIKPLPGLVDCVEKLKKNSYKIGYLSDFPLQNKLNYLGLSGYTCAFTSENVNYLKPHPEPFIELAKRMNLEPKEILYVGNSYEKDIIGAYNVGMKTAHYSMIKNRNSIADITFHNYKNLYAEIKKLYQVC